MSSPQAGHRPGAPRPDRRLALIALTALAGMAWLPGCASTSHSRPGILGRPEGVGATTLSAQLEVVVNDPSPPDTRRVIFVGAALNSREDVFDRDIRLFDAALRNLYGAALRSVLLSNIRVFEGERRLPLATIEHLDQVFHALNAQRREGDRYVLLLSTHGLPGVLEVEQAALHPPSRALVTAKINAWVQLLSPLPTWLVISSCYAGSHLGQKAPAHVIAMVAAAANRASFGCSNSERNTWFIEALVNAITQPGPGGAVTFDAVWRRTAESVSRRESEGRFQPSLPEWRVGPRMHERRQTRLEDF